MSGRSELKRFGLMSGALWVLLAVVCLVTSAGCEKMSAEVEDGQRLDREAATNVRRRAPDPGIDAPNSGEGSESSVTDRSPFMLTEVTESWGVDFTYRNGEDRRQYTILESLGGGVAVLDFDRDGHPDLFCPGGGTFENQRAVGLDSELFRNGSGSRYVAVGQAAGGGFPARCYTHGAFVADYNNDGFPDVLVTGYGGLQLWKNQGDGTFVEVHQDAGLEDEQWSSAAAWADFDGNGSLDLYVAHYVDWSFDNHPFCRGRNASERDICPPREFAGLRDKLYLSNRDGTFRDATEAWGLRADGKGLGVVVADLTGDGHVDIYVANDTTNNFLYVNEGEPPLREVASIAGLAADKAGIPNGSMGVDLLDFNGSGRADVWVTNYEREDFALYRNEGPGAFLHVSDVAGLNVLGGLFVGFGTTCADMDLDGQEDILVNNGHVILYPTASPRAQLPLAMLASGERFRRVRFPAGSYMRRPHEGRGLALGDLDGDGDLDAIFSNLNAPVAILENRPPESGHWLQVKLVGTRSSRDAIGATVTATVGDRQMLRVRKGGGSYLSTSQEALAWGLGTADHVDSLKVRWPDGRETVLEDVAANQTLLVVEPADG